MSTQETFLYNADESFTLINACYAITEQYRMILSDIGKENNLSENEMLVLVHLALNPEACTQKKLQATNLHLFCFLHLPHGGVAAEKGIPDHHPG